MRIPAPSSLSVGTDIILWSRIAKLCRTRPQRLQRFASRILHPFELRDLSHRFPDWQENYKHSSCYPNPAITWLAGRWAAKEAAKKAWGASLLSFRDLRVEVHGSGEVLVVCDTHTDGVERDHLQQAAKLSISHDGEYVVAVVLAAPLHSDILRELGRKRSEAEKRVTV